MDELELDRLFVSAELLRQRIEEANPRFNPDMTDYVRQAVLKTAAHRAQVIQEDITSILKGA